MIGLVEIGSFEGKMSRFFVHDNRFAGEACNLLFMTIESPQGVLSIYF